LGGPDPDGADVASTFKALFMSEGGAGREAVKLSRVHFIPSHHSYKYVHMREREREWETGVMNADSFCVILQTILGFGVGWGRGGLIKFRVSHM
jgi:hypothetical protein